MNAAEVLIDQGHVDRAAVALVDVRRVLGAAGYAAALSYAELLSAIASLRTGELDLAVASLERCASAFRAGAMQLYALEAELRLAEAALQRGRSDEAAAIAQRALEESKSLARRGVVVVRAQRVLGMAAFSDGRSDAAITHLTAAVDACRAADLRYELAVTIQALAFVTPEVEHLLPEANRIFDELGVNDAGRHVAIAGVTAPG
jgi:tetratricopeptide (TPR) repeat protein